MSGHRRRWTVDGVPPCAVAALALLLGSLFVTARWVFAADGDVARFVVAGDLLTSSAAGIPVLQGPGYDGQFSYRLAVEPAALGSEAHGVTLDSALRLQRITYPVLVHLAALGQQSWVPAALVLVNLLMLGLVAFSTAVLARDAGRSPLCGLLVAGFFGFVATLARDLTELTTAALLLAGVLAWQRGRLPAAGLAFSGAALSRESALLFIGAFVLAELAASRRAADRWQRLVAAVAPLLAFCTWQAVCWRANGEVPLLASRGRNLVLPGQDLVPATVDWARGAVALERAALVDLGQFAALALIVAMAGGALRRSSSPVGVKAAWVAALLLVLSLSASVWRGPADFRTASELYVASVLVLLGSTRSLRVPAALLLVTTPLTSLLRVVDL